MRIFVPLTLIVIVTFLLPSIVESSSDEQRARDILDQMTQNEKFSMMNGIGWGKPSSFEFFHTLSLSSYGKTHLKNRLLDTTARILCGNDTSDNEVGYTLLEHARRRNVNLLFRSRFSSQKPRNPTTTGTGFQDVRIESDWTGDVLALCACFGVHLES